MFEELSYHTTIVTMGCHCQVSNLPIEEKMCPYDLWVIVYSQTSPLLTLMSSQAPYLVSEMTIQHR